MGEPFHPAIELDRLETALSAANRRRLATNDTSPTPLDLLLGTDQHLVVYGSLAPGGSNAGELADMEGNWHEGWVTGTLHESGWGAAMGYPALEWSSRGERVPASLLVSPDLPRNWARLDAFEGREYCRILVPFFDADGVRAVGNLYERAIPG